MYKATTIVQMAFNVVMEKYGPVWYRRDNNPTQYSYEYNVGKWYKGRWCFDCLGFVHCMVNNFQGNKDLLGGGATMDDFVLMSGEDKTLNTYCSTRGGFPKTNLKPAALLKMSGHVGLFLGEMYAPELGQTINTAEVTMSMGGGGRLSWVDLATGARYTCKGGQYLGRWTDWGYFDRVDYSDTPTPQPTPTPTTDVAKYMPVIKKGSEGDAVKVLQTILARLGHYKGTVDGDAGPMTDAAIRAFQKAEGLGVDGSCGPASWGRIISTYPANFCEAMPQIKYGSHGDMVLVLQTALKYLGYYNGNLDSDAGYYTVASIKSLQKDAGIGQDGICGPKTWAAVIGKKKLTPDEPKEGTPLTKDQANHLMATMQTPSKAAVEAAAAALGMDEDETMAYMAWVQGEGYWEAAVNDGYLAYLSACVMVNNIIKGFYGRGEAVVKRIASWGSYYSRDKQEQRARTMSNGALKAAYLALKHLQPGIYACYGPGYKPEKCFYDPHFKAQGEWVYVF